MSQPSSNDIDLFRMKVLQGIIEGEKRREAERARRERACFHRFEPQPSSEPIPMGYMLCVCSKCERHIWRRIPSK
jgi:hypothetical protein